jgi:hypothetical protein
VGTKIFDFVFFAKVFAKFNFRFREKILAKVRNFQESFRENMIFFCSRAATLRLKPNEALCCSSSAKVTIQKLPSSLLTVAHQVYKLKKKEMFPFYHVIAFCNTYSNVIVFVVICICTVTGSLGSGLLFNFSVLSYYPFQLF